MNKLIVASALSLFAASAQADVITCTFTEPFYTTAYDTTKGTLKYRNDGEENQPSSVYTHVSLRTQSDTEFELIAQNGTVMQKITLDYKGSDGMSDKVYPFSVEDTSGIMEGAANNAMGGCVSNNHKSIRGL